MFGVIIKIIKKNSVLVPEQRRNMEENKTFNNQWIMSISGRFCYYHHTVRTGTEA